MRKQLEDEEGCVLVAARGIGCHRLSDAILDDDAAVVTEGGVADGRLHTDAGGGADHDEGLDIPGTEVVIELGL